VLGHRFLAFLVLRPWGGNQGYLLRLRGRSGQLGHNFHSCHSVHAWSRGGCLLLSMSSLQRNTASLEK